jgi:DNA-binding LacI/PurR family transcriptional regulator
MQATINDVARLAGVSKGTVSKYLNQTNYVSAVSKAKIASAIAELRYAPNRMAQSLSLRRSYTIGLVVANIGNPFYAELIRGAEDVAASLGFTLLLASTDGEPKRESGIVKAMRQHQVDGIVFASVRLGDREVTALARDGMKVVLASRHLPAANVDMVLVDNVRGARMAVEHLLAHGHKRIAYIGGPENIAQFQDRAQGWREALAIAGLPAPSELYLALDKMDVEAGFVATPRLMRVKHPPTAIFAATDNLAFGVLKACSRFGYSVPDKLAVVGFDNVPFDDIALVPLTSVDGSGFNIGQRALRLLVDRINNEAEPDAKYSPVRMVIQPTLCIRESCGCKSDKRSG